eukprot:gnl/TRDRNA2_/TRDRNA2_75789_c0_seq1.p1 gnl/TRDRNA2_/TRDRNA2_75789_c0~~gnl/TRDRNA2_/TRDRNA2_75789_c0_seq1.p1  ORF type:complete len:137 (-),score=10.78 gnl/TRDRNA2_/TRDRNA2_75789_c0_seq1:104-514(-)
MDTHRWLQDFNGGEPPSRKTSAAASARSWSGPLSPKASGRSWRRTWNLEDEHGTVVQGEALGEWRDGIYTVSYSAAVRQGTGAQWDWKYILDTPDEPEELFVCDAVPGIGECVAVDIVLLEERRRELIDEALQEAG